MAPWSVCKVFDDPDDCYWAWTHIFGQICNKHAPLREIKVRRQSLPWVIIRKYAIWWIYATNLFLKQNYLTIKNCGQSIAQKQDYAWRVSKCKFYGDLFDKVKIISHIGSWSKRLLTATKMLHLLAEEIHTQIRNSVWDSRFTHVLQRFVGTNFLWNMAFLTIKLLSSYALKRPANT